MLVATKRQNKITFFSETIRRPPKRFRLQSKGLFKDRNKYYNYTTVAGSFGRTSLAIRFVNE